MYVNPETPLQEYILTTTAGLCDPFSQPEESDTLPLTCDVLADVLIGILYQHMIDDLRHLEVNSIKFDLSTELFLVLHQIQVVLRADKELDLRFVENDELYWQENVHLWTPQAPDDLFRLRLLYSITCVIIVAIHKLFLGANGECNLALNPYLHYLIRMWKCHSNIIILGLEIDRRLENENDENGTLFETPEIIKYTLRGLSAIRLVLAWILNQNPSLSLDNEADHVYDIKTAPILDLIHPVLRRSTGALLIDMRLVIIALLVSNVGITAPIGRPPSPSLRAVNEDEYDRRLDQAKPITEIGDLLIDLEYEDKFDDDIRYMFGYEFDDDSVSLATDLQSQSQTNQPVLMAVRSLNDIEFDEMGRDWRDVPRGANVEFAPWFVDIVSLHDETESDHFFHTFEELCLSLEYLTTNTLDQDGATSLFFAQAILNTISKAIKDENEGTDSSITPDRIYRYLTTAASEEQLQEFGNNLVPFFTVTNFEMLLRTNSPLGRAIMDEMLMCKGYRRVLIWFLTHNVNLLPLLIDYVHELLAGLRGSKEYKFTRQGQVVLSDVEQLMLLHEFLNMCELYLSASDGVETQDGGQVVLSESVARKLITLLCLMINQLIRVGIIDLDKRDDDGIHNYYNDLQVLLVDWVGKLPEARALFFKVKEKYVDRAVGEVTEVVDYEQLQKIVDRCVNLQVWEVTDFLSADSKAQSCLHRYVMRMEIHLKTIIGLQTAEIDKVVQVLDSADILAKDFRFFLINFNTLCKMEHVAEPLFLTFEKIVASGHLESEEVEAEFNDEFLNGEGHFDEGKKKKKKKKKNKKKK